MSRLRSYFVGVGFLVGCALVILAVPAEAHEERVVREVAGDGSRPQYRTLTSEALLVCKNDRTALTAALADATAAVRRTNLALWQRCQDHGYRDIQAAVDHAPSGSQIEVLPGVYQEQPSLAVPAGQCSHLSAPWSRFHTYQILSFEQQQECPHNQNLIAVLGKRDIQIEGTGPGPDDVVIDAQFKRLNAIRADRADGIYLRNLTVQRTTFNSVYIMESDGFVIDRVVARWNNEYGFLTFADDHGLYENCEAYGNGDSGLYPGAAKNVNRLAGDHAQRYAIEISRCHAHDNTVGYAGTAGDSVWVHDSTFTNNAVGVGTDSLFPHHPGMPQNHALFERNVISDNNGDYLANVRAGTCAKPPEQQGIEHGIVCPKLPPPEGTGVLQAGGNYDVWRNNTISGNHRVGVMLVWVPGFVRNDYRLGAQFDTSHHNRVYGNGLASGDGLHPSVNGLDFWWDGQGIGNCWQADARSEPIAMPRCDQTGHPKHPAVGRYLGEPNKTLKLYICLTNSNVVNNQFASNCSWFGASGIARIEVQTALAEALTMALVMLLIVRRLPGRRARIGLLLALAGLAVGVVGAAYDGSPLAAIGLGLRGVGLLVIGGALIGVDRRPLGVLTSAVGILAVLGAVDRGLWVLPWLPAPTTWFRLLTEIAWVTATVVAAARRRR